jgi:hypothetical protein
MPTKKKSTRKKQTGGRKIAMKKGTQSGKGALDNLKKVHNFVKNNHLISAGLALTGYKPAAAVASMLGYGRKRSGTAKRGTAKNPIKMGTLGRQPARTQSHASLTKAAMQNGTGIFSDFGGGVGSIFKGLGSGLFGNGRKKKGTRKR